MHRLDRPTSGVLIFALSSESAQMLTQEFSDRRVSKKYWAFVRGTTPSKTVIDYALKEELDPISDAKANVKQTAKEAVTEIKTLAHFELPIQVDRYPTSRYSLVEAKPLTGRKHQIRRHLKHLGHPIIGDVNHGVGKHNRFFKEEFQTSRLLLSCREISFRHPRTGESVSVRAPLCEDFKALLSRLDWAENVD